LSNGVEMKTAARVRHFALVFALLLPSFSIAKSALIGLPEISDTIRIISSRELTPAERKQLLRLLVKDVTLTKEATTIRVALRWQTEACTTVAVPRPPRSCDARRTAAAVVDRLRVLAKNHTDGQVAEQLNTEGYKPGLGGVFTAKKVQWIRHIHRIPNSCPEGPAACKQRQRGDGRCCAQTAAQALNVTVSTIADWCKSGRLDGIQTTPHGPWWVRLTPEVVKRLRKPVQRRWKKRSSQ